MKTWQARYFLLKVTMKMTHNHCDVNYLLFSDCFNFQSDYFAALKMEKGFEAQGRKIHHEGLPLPINMPVKNIVSKTSWS